MIRELYRAHQWYQHLPKWQQWLTLLSLAVWTLAVALWITHEPRERTNRPAYILKNCDVCGVDPARQISQQEYNTIKKDTQRTSYEQERQRLRQEEWDRRGRERWCRNHPRDPNCKNTK
jgi:hypothetical protein